MELEEETVSAMGHHQNVATVKPISTPSCNDLNASSGVFVRNIVMSLKTSMPDSYVRTQENLHLFECCQYIQIHVDSNQENNRGGIVR
jgi:hypothetical protein